MQLECFFYQGFLSRTLTTHRTEREGRGPFFYSTLPFRPAHEHSYGSLQLCMWDVYHTFLIATLVYTRLLLDETYHLIELPFDWFIDDARFVCLLDELVLGFCYRDLTWETSGFEFASTITLVLHAKRLTKCASYCTSSIFMGKLWNEPWSLQFLGLRNNRIH